MQTKLPFLMVIIIIALIPLTTLNAKDKTMSDDLKKTAIDVTSRADKNLTKMQEYVTQHDGTEPPFKNEYWDHHEEGIYVDIISGEALFSSTDKFDSGTGWPSFTQPIQKQATKSKEDKKLFTTRTEIRSADSNAHLGHVFDDGPKDKGGKRFCINSAALDFIAKADMAEKGYKEYLYLFEEK